jgi:hypothetical protein
MIFVGAPDGGHEDERQHDTSIPLASAPGVTCSIHSHPVSVADFDTRDPKESPNGSAMTARARATRDGRMLFPRPLLHHRHLHDTGRGPVWGEELVKVSAKYR